MLKTFFQKTGRQIFLGGRFLFSLPFSFFDRFFRRRNEIVVFCYHSIAGDGWRFSLEREKFEKQIDFLLERRLSLTAAELTGFFDRREISGPAFLLTFDDGYRDIYQMRDFLKKRGIKPLVFLLGKPGSADRSELSNRREFLPKKEILNLLKDGWAVGCHSATHPDFEKLDRKTLQKEISAPKIALEKKLGAAVDYFAFPKGRYTAAVLEAVAESNYRLGFSMDFGLIGRQTDPLIIPRVGVDRTHSFAEFKILFFPSVIKAKALAKRFL